MREVEVAGVATTRFGKHLDRSLGSLAAEATHGALSDAAIPVARVDRVVFSNAAAGVLSGQEMIRGQVALKGTGLEGLPLINTENACASGGSAVHLAWLAVASGQAETVLVVGVEKLHHPDKQRSFDAIESGTDRSLAPREATSGPGSGSGSVMMDAYAQEARAYAVAHDVDLEGALAALAVKNRSFASGNPHAQFREPISVAQVQASRPVSAPLRLLTCSPLTDGAAAVVLQARDAGASSRQVVIDGCELASYRPGSSVVGRTATTVYRRTGITAADVDVFQLHDACAFAELLQYEQVGLAPPGRAVDAVLDGRTGPGGAAPVNTDGGLLSRGHALGATGIAQLAELTLQLQGRAAGRQVDAARRGLAVNAGGWMGDDYAAATVTSVVVVDAASDPGSAGGG